MFQMNHDQVDSSDEGFIPRSPLSISNLSSQVVAERSANHLDIRYFPSTEENDLDKACHVQWIRTGLILDLKSQQQRMIQNAKNCLHKLKSISHAMGESYLWLMSQHVFYIVVTKLTGLWKTQKAGALCHLELTKNTKWDKNPNKLSNLFKQTHLKTGLTCSSHSCTLERRQLL